MQSQRNKKTKKNKKGLGAIHQFSCRQRMSFQVGDVHLPRCMSEVPTCR